ncbi:MAG: ABC transporter ATP-binding protein, partial [Proteobacteria bacterium]|nr:ABC transporter ATP-binding protein [Pseudomonadota bacterium]
MKTDHSLGKKVRQAIRLDRAIGFVWQASPNWTLASLVLLVLQGTLPLLALYVMKLIIDAVAFSLTAPDKVAAFWNIGLLIIAAAGVALLNAFLQLMA